jgi:membrane protein DedA with SNARE-associated domain
MREQLLAAVSQYGSPALFVVVMVASLGAPLPIALLLIVTGSLAAQGAMNIWTAILVAGTGSVLGDLAGYAIGRWGGVALVDRFCRVLGGRNRLEEIERRARQRAGLYVFLTRWLLSPLGPWVNLASGIAGYPWGRFLLWDVLGEFFGVAIYISLGEIFSDRVMALDSVLGDVTWGVLALTVAVLVGRALLSYARPARREAP